MSVDRIGRAGLPDLSGLTILVVDDTEDALDLLSGYLTACGAHVLAAANGLAALTYLATNVHIDVVVSDLTMPYMDGAQLLRWIRAEEGRCRVPVVALTGYPKRYVEKDARFDAFLEKPVNLDRLCEVIRTMVENAKAPGATPRVPQSPHRGKRRRCFDDAVDRIREPQSFPATDQTPRTGIRSGLGSTGSGGQPP